MAVTSCGKTGSQHGRRSIWRRDYLLVRKYLSGDTGAWEELYRRAYPVALHFLRHLSARLHLAESDMPDILSEAFLRCQTGAHRFQGRSSFSTYVCGYVRYIALEAARKQISHRQKQAAASALLPTEELNINPERILLRRERDQYLWTAYGALTTRHRVLIGYLVLEQNTYQEARRITTSAAHIADQANWNIALVTAAVTLLVSTVVKVGIRSWCRYYEDRHPDVQKGRS